MLIHKVCLSGLLGCLILTASQSLAQPTSVCQQASRIVHTATQHHIAPRPVDDAFSEIVFTSTLQSLDAHHLLFSRNEWAQLARFKHTLDEEINDQHCSFVSEVTLLYRAKLLSADSLLQHFQGETFNVHRTDSITFHKDGRFDQQEPLADRWRKRIHLQMLLADLSAGNSTIASRPAPARWDSIQAVVLSREACRIAARLSHDGGVEQYVGDAFLKAIASAYDPHTAYFTLSEENEFEQMLSDEALAYGFQLDKNEAGAIEIIGLTPGSPAWNSGELNEGDVMLEVTPSQGETKDFSCIAVEEAARFLSGEVNEASFRIHKQNGKQITVTLFKEKISVEENLIQSFLLGQNSRTGYIYLPSFYAHEDSDPYPSRGCANDVAKELIKLKQEGIDGLVIDLRNNGGGSMAEAIHLAGLFVDYGAISIIDSRYEEVTTLKDMHRGTVYDGPLVVLLNTFSASASELFAAALQDHHRALIVGSPSFGKSTAQQVLPLSERPADGFLKLTTGKFYRVTGKSHQKKGVQPDVPLPDLYEQLNLREKDSPGALEVAAIHKKTYYSPLPALPLETLRARSTQRVANDSVFHQIEQMSSRLAQFQGQQAVPLNYANFYSYYATRMGASRTSDESDKEASTLLSVKNPSYREALRSPSDIQQMVNGRALRKIRSDRHVQEAYDLTNDLIELTKK